MKNNYLHTGNTTKKSSGRARPVFRAFVVVAAVTLAGVALVAGPEHLSAGSNKSRIVRRILTLQPALSTPRQEAARTQ